MTMKTNYETLFKLAFERRDTPSCLDIIDMGLREDGDDFREWLAKDALLAVTGYGLLRQQDGHEPLDEFVLPVAQRLAEVIQHFPRN